MKLDYYEREGLSQSRLKLILKHPMLFYNNDRSELYKKVPKENILIGNAVDCILTEPDLFEDKFMVTDVTIPTGQYLTFVNEYYKLKTEERSEEECCQIAFARSKSKTESNLELWCKELENDLYLKYLYDSETKQILTSDQKITVDKIVKSFKESPFTSSYFNTAGDEQVEIFWDYEGVPMKSKLDKVIENKFGQLEPLDIKTTETVGNFWNIFDLMNYKFQAVSYTLALKRAYPDRDIARFKFIVNGVKYQRPLIFEISDETFNAGLLEFKDAIKRYKFHKENNIWEYTMDQYQNNGIVSI